MERIFEQISTSVRYRKGPYYVRRYGDKFSPGQKKLADKARKLRPYFELDISTGLLQTRILLDRVVSVSRCFLKGPKLPSFTSFSNHKKFLNTNSIKGHEEYVRYFREETDWFDKPIKYIRDKFFVHQGPKHWMCYTIGWENDDNLTLSIILNKGKNEIEDNERLLHFNPWRMSYDVENFLKWFSIYASNNFEENS
jgi:hypothetical protein